MSNENDQKTPPQEEGDDKKYSFLQETIKGKPMDREHLVKQFVKLAIYGLIIGVFACLGFFALKPVMNHWFHGEKEKLTISQDGDGDVSSSENEGTQEGQQVDSDEIEYEQMLASMSKCAKDAEKSIVSVEVVPSPEEWSDRMTRVRKSMTGVIIADDGQELLILTNSGIVEDGDEWAVTFSNGTRVGASFKKQDKNRGLAVFSVSRNELDESTLNTVKVAVLGNSSLIKRGDTVLALGNMFGYSQSMAYGLVNSSDYRSTFYDGECDVIATDIISEKNGTGILFNMNAEVIGIISPSIWENADDATVNAFGVSDMKPVIELIMNAKSVPYIGIHGTTVTEELIEQHEMPEGIYVVEVDPDSPAMMAGIQAGDIIYRLAGEDVKTFADYEKILLDTAVGTPVKLLGKRQGTEEYVDVSFSVITGRKE